MIKWLNNNNPFNIRYSKRNNWLGQVNSIDGEFVAFENVNYGLRAGVKLIKNYIFKGINTVPLIVSRFAPESENDTKSYIKRVLYVTKATEDLVIRFDTPCFWLLCYAILQVESGVLFPISYLKSAFSDV